MIVAKTILYILLFVILAILVLLLILLIIPFTYKLVLHNKNNTRYEIHFNYLFIKLKSSIVFKPKLIVKVKLFDKLIVDTSVKKEKTKKNSIEDTSFIKNKSLSKELTNEKNEVKNLFLSAKNLAKNIKVKNNNNLSKVEKENKVKSATNKIDKFKKIFPSDFIYVIKKLVTEGIYAFNVIRPTNCSVNMKLDRDDPFRNGIIMSVAAPLYAMFGSKVKTTQDSKNGTTFVMTFTGRPMLIKLVGPIMKLLLDKKVRKFIFKKK